MQYTVKMNIINIFYSLTNIMIILVKIVNLKTHFINKK